MSTQREIQFYAKISQAIQTLFDEDSENQIDREILEEDGALNDFFHVLATRVPQMVFAKLTNQNLDPLEFNQTMTKLIFTKAIEQAEKKTK
ncbi:hypothetical protein [Flavobacterium sp.]|uniref:hypothetical protein n=1 Tax=Flavobacterium sp. TaxID=239 RepID=UPI00404750A2